MFKAIAKLFAGTTTVTPARKVRLCVEGMEDRTTPTGLPNPGDTVLIAHWNPPTVALGHPATVIPSVVAGGIGIPSRGGTVSIPSIPPGSGGLAAPGLVIVGG